MKHARRLIAVAIPAVMYVTSLISPVLSSPIKGDPDDFNGFDAFEVGWKATFELEEWDLERTELTLAWLANVAFAVALVLICIGRRRCAAVISGLACLLSMCVLPLFWSGLTEHTGYWLWWGSMLMAMFAALFILPRPRNQFVDDYGPLKTLETSTPAST